MDNSHLNKNSEETFHRCFSFSTQENFKGMEACWDFSSLRYLQKLRVGPQHRQQI